MTARARIEGMRFGSAALLCFVLACGGAGTGSATGNTGGSTGTSGQGAGLPGTGGSLPSCEPASEPFGVADGESFPDLELTTCDGGKVTLDQLRCGHAITLVSVGAGWCEPCKEEAPELQTAAEALGDQGVGVVQVMFQDASGLPATTLFCDTWTETFSLTIPVLIDPVGNTLDFFDQAQTPLNFVVDREGEVLWAQTGKPDDVQALLASLLP